MIVKNGIRCDHRFITKPQLRHIIFGIITQACIIACLGKFDPLNLFNIGIIADLNLIETVNAAFGHIEIFEQRQACQIMAVGTGNQCFPVAGRLHAGGGYAEVHMIIIGQNEQTAIAHIDAILPSDFARRDQNGRRSWIVGGHQAYFTGDIVACANDNPILLCGQANTDAKADIVFLIDQLRLAQVIAQFMIPGIVCAPIVVGQAINHTLIIR